MPAPDPEPAPTGEPPAPKERSHVVRAALSWLLAAAVLAGVTVAAVRATPQGRPPDLLDRLNVNELGSTWVYAVTANGKPSGKHWVQVAQTGFVAGSAATVTYEHYDDFLGRPLSAWTYSRRDGNRVVTVGSRLNNDYVTYDPPKPNFVLPMSNGQTWRYDGKRGDSPLRTTTEVVGRETVRVVGRDVPNCLHLRQAFPDENEVDDYWICPGIGQVKSTTNAQPTATFEGVQAEEELVAYHVPGGGAGSVGAVVPTQPMEPDQAVTTGYVPDAHLNLGRLSWSDTKATDLNFPPVGRKGLVVTAESDGTVAATDTQTGEILWRLKVPAPVPSAPALIGDTVFVAGADKSLFALEATTGWARWIARFDDVTATAPVRVGDVVVVADDARRVHALSMGDGHEVWSTRTGDRIRTDVAAAGGDVIVADVSGGVVALDAKDGSTVWDTSLDDVLTSGPVVGEGLAVVGDDGGTLSAFDAATGQLRWTAYPNSSVRSAPAISPQRIVAVASDTERLVSLDPSNGHLQWSARLNESVTAPPMILGDEVVVVDDVGRVRRFDAMTGRERPSTQLHAPSGRVAFSTEVPMTVIGDDLVVPLDLQAPWPLYGQILAFPLRGSGGRPPGARFSGELLTLPGISTMTAPPVRVGGDVMVAVKHEDVPLRDVYSIGAGGTREIAVSESLIPFVVPAGPNVLVQEGEDLVALPAGGGEPVWRFHMGAPRPGTGPAVSGDVVVVPVNGKGYVGLGLRDGKQRWSFDVTQPSGTGSPVVLPNGDVLVGLGTFARLDVQTGKPRWEISFLTSFAPPAFEGNVAVLHGFLGNDHAVVVGVDLTTGTLKWTQQGNPHLASGPAVEHGVVVTADNVGHVIGRDLQTGAEVWSMDLRTPPSGSPVVTGGRATILEEGRTEDLYDREMRVVILDVATGAYLGAYEPDATGFAFVGAFGAIGDAVAVPGISAGHGALGLFREVGP